MRQNKVAPLGISSILLCLGFTRLNFMCLSLMCLSLTGCMQTAEQMASKHGFKKTALQTNPFILTSFQKFRDPHDEAVTIYIEGDGRTWITRTKLSANPTPHNPLALKLAILDKSANVAYLARPCQYTPLHLNSACNPAIWSDLRFSEIVIHSMNEGIEKIKKEANAQTIHLVGFSGGAAIATLIAANRTDIATLRTIAGDLNHPALSEYHQTTPLHGSLNPMSFVYKLTTLPQQHFAGEKDHHVPPFIAQKFTDEVLKQGGHCTTNMVLIGVTHQQGWEQAWPTLLNTPFKCLLK